MSSENNSSNLRTRTVPLQEYILQGSILDTNCELLLHRLRGLCDNGDSPTETYQDREYVYTMRQPGGQLMTIRARKDAERINFPWHLRYLGQSEVGSQNRATMVRSCIEVACSERICQFLEEMGFELSFTFIMKGYLFKKGRMKINVAKVSKESRIEEKPDFLTNSYLVEVSVVAPSGQDALANEIKAFADQLKPLVNLEKIDSRRL